MYQVLQDTALQAFPAAMRRTDDPGMGIGKQYGKAVCSKNPNSPVLLQRILRVGFNPVKPVSTGLCKCFFAGFSPRAGNGTVRSLGANGAADLFQLIICADGPRRVDLGYCVHAGPHNTIYSKPVCVHMAGIISDFRPEIAECPVPLGMPAEARRVVHSDARSQSDGDKRGGTGS